MLLALLLSVSASSAGPGCLDPTAEVQLAWSVFERAEIEEAEAHLDAAEGALTCQTRVVQPAELLELYRLRALLAWTMGDLQQTRVALEAAVAVDHRASATPPAKYGPELVSQWATIAADAVNQLVSVRVEGATAAWIDGRRVDPGAPLRVAPGPHLVQHPVADAAGLRYASRVVQVLVSPYTISTGRPSSASTPPRPPAERPAPVPPPPAARARRRRPAALIVGAAAAAVGSAYLVALARGGESRFQASSYRAQSYPSLADPSVECAFGESCYADARARAIRTDAGRINRVYGAGYGLAALSGGLLTVTIVGLPGGSRQR